MTKTKIFNIVVYAMLFWSILSAGYLALPAEYQEMLPQMNWLVAVISGGSTALLGSGGLAVQAYLAKAKTTSDTKFNLLKDNYLQLVDHYISLENQYKELKTSVDYNNKLLAVDLKTKLDNPLITETSEQLIKQVLTNDSQE